MNIEQSAAVIFESRNLLADGFYESFLIEFPAMQKYFKETDFKRQGIMLTLALSVIERYYTKRTHVCHAYLRELGKSHKGRHIPASEYEHWIKAMFGSLQKFHGDDWSQLLETQWREALDLAVSVMISAYDDNGTETST